MRLEIIERESRFKLEVRIQLKKGERDFETKSHNFLSKLNLALRAMGEAFRVKTILSTSEEGRYTVSGPLKEKKTVREIVEKFAAEFFKKSK
jgi:hypothetical protein